MRNSTPILITSLEDLKRLRNGQQVHVTIRCAVITKGHKQGVRTPILLPLFNKYSNISFNEDDIKTTKMVAIPGVSIPKRK